MFEKPVKKEKMITRLFDMGSFLFETPERGSKKKNNGEEDNSRCLERQM